MTVFGCADLVDSYSAFYENDRTTTGLAGYLRERGFKRAFLAGLDFDFCVRYSAEDAALHGLEAIVPAASGAPRSRLSRLRFARILPAAVAATIDVADAI